MYLKSPVEPNPLQQTASCSTLPFPANFIIPSPSLPNLSNNPDQLPMDYASLMMQASFASFLSMPSLFKNPFLPNSILDPLDAAAAGRKDGGGGEFYI